MLTNKYTGSLIAIAIATGGAGAAFGQAGDAATRSIGTDSFVADIVVTGSRVATGATAPTPVTIVTPEAINKVATPNIADALTQLPALASTLTANRGGTLRVLGSLMNLRNMGIQRTLTLVDGKRFVGTPTFETSAYQGVNVDSIPQGLVQRVDTVTGGASAAYGSDAVAGVVNFVLDKEFEGIKGEAAYGMSPRGDGQRYKFDLSAGGSFADNRGHVVVNLAYGRDVGVTNDMYGENPRRPFQREDRILGKESVGGQVVLVPQGRLVMFPLNGLVVGCTLAGSPSPITQSCPVYGTSFNDAGTASYEYDFGVRNSPTSQFAVGGDGAKIGSVTVVGTPNWRYSMYSRVSYDVTSSLNVYADVLSATTKTKSDAGSGSLSFITGSALGMPVGLDYEFLPPELRAEMIANDVTSINIQKMFLFNIKQDFDVRTNRFVVGATNDFGKGWTGELYYTYGEVRSKFSMGNFTDVNRMKSALTTTRDADGNIICAEDLENGCVPYNLFGREHPLNAPLQAYMNPPNYMFNKVTQQVVEGTVQGSLLALPAGDLTAAFGAGFRQETMDRSSDARDLSSKRNPYTGGIGGMIYLNTPAVKGKLKMWELFAEAQVPVLADVPLANMLELNVAGRYTDYSSSGGVKTWKAGAIYEPISDIRFRGAISRDVRAASLIELYSPQATGFGTILDPEKGGATVNYTPLSGGNPQLTPEKADTITAGVVLRPSFLSGFYVSADYFSIKMSDRIGTIAGQRVVDLCRNGEVSMCAIVNRNSSGDLVSIQLTSLNLAKSTTRGLDVEMGYSQPLSLFGSDGNFSARAFGTYIFENSTATIGAPKLDESVVPGRFIAMGTVDYQTGPWSFSILEHYTGGGRHLATDMRYAGDKASGQFRTDLAVRYDWDNVQIYGTVQNLFDANPPSEPVTGVGGSRGANAIYDIQGIRFMGGIKFRM